MSLTATFQHEPAVLTAALDSRHDRAGMLLSPAKIFDDFDRLR